MTESDIRLATIREICRREGHGELIEITTFQDRGYRDEYLCQRGCGAKIYRLMEPHAVEEIQRRWPDGLIQRNGVIELWPAEEASA